MYLEKITVSDGQVGLKAADWTEAIRLAAKPLLDDGAIKSEYIDAMIESVKVNGPYFVITKGVALAHARPNCGVIRSGLKITLLDEPVAFGAGENDPVSLIITLAATGNNDHLDVLSEIAEILMDSDKMDKIMNAKTAEELHKYLIN